MKILLILLRLFLCRHKSLKLKATNLHFEIDVVSAKIVFMIVSLLSAVGTGVAKEHVPPLPFADGHPHVPVPPPSGNAGNGLTDEVAAPLVDVRPPVVGRRFSLRLASTPGCTATGIYAN